MQKLDYLILGPVEVTLGGEVVHAGGARQRSVLAMLLLRSNEAVSADRLIDDLWGERPPEDAATALQQHVSRLRKQLGPSARLLTRPPGYVLEVDPDQVDLLRFRTAVDTGRRQLADGDVDGAASTLAGALALWRGRPLADLDGDFARDAAAQLEDERLAALELRLQADLALGRHVELASELTTLVREHPLRERLRGQLMLALYRSGRQADALEVYARGRRLFSSELGLEPGAELRDLHHAILNHDDALAAPAAPVSGDSRTARARRRLVPVAAGLAGVVVVAAIVLTVVLAGRDGSDQTSTSGASAGAGVLLELDGRSGAVRRRVQAGRTPSALAATADAVWMLDADTRTVVASDATGRANETLSVGQTPTDVAATANVVWVMSGRPLEGSQFVGPVATTVTRLDRATRTPRAEVRLPPPTRSVVNLVESRLAASRTAVWAVTADSALVRIDAQTSAITGTSRALRYAAVAAEGERVWALGIDGSVAALDERTGRVVRRARIQTPSPASIAVGQEGAWMTSSSDGLLWRIGQDGTSPPSAITLSPGITDVAVGAGFIWVVNPTEGTLVQVDPGAGRVRRTIRVGGIPRAVTTLGDRVWVVATADGAPAVTREVSGVTALPGSICEDVVAGEGRPADLLIVSDLPLQGGTRLTTTQMTQAITFVLRERGFRAGRFRVAYQSCDDSVSRSGLPDEAKCAANARAYGEDQDVIGVIGTLNSGCALVAVPVLNRARGGAVPIVSPSNSVVGLTRSGPGTPPGLPGSLYPTGRRNYLRVFPTDDLQGAAHALLARNRGHSKVFVLDDGDPLYGSLWAAGFDVATRNLGVQVAGRARWDPQATGFRELAERVARSGATAVFLGGLLDSGGARLVRALRARLDRSVELYAPDGFTPVGLFVEQAGEAAIGTFVSVGGIVTGKLPPAGAAFVERFAPTQAGTTVQSTAVYAAQATSVLLDAIARSDGTRDSVVKELFNLRVENGLLGSFSFTPEGDSTESPITILRVTGPGRSDVIQGTEGATVEEVIRPPQSLVASGG